MCPRAGSPSTRLVGVASTNMSAGMLETASMPVMPDRPWGEKAFTGYLGPDRQTWRRYDACELVAESGWRTPILVDQGTTDPFLEEQLKPHLFREACDAAGTELELRIQPGYDHSYYFIASFMADHFAHHAQILQGPAPRS